MRMRAAIVEEPNKVRIREVERPKIDDYEVLLRMKACAICNGTDLKIIGGHLGTYPAILGHEGLGEVIEIGKKVRSFKMRDWVLEPFAKIKEKRLYSGFGDFAEYAVAWDYPALLEDGKNPNPVHKRHQIVPKDIDPNEATIICTLKETLSGLLNFGFQEGMTLVIFGDGPVGCALAQFARLRGAEMVIGVGHWEKRLRKMKALGADYVVNEKRGEFPSQVLKEKKADLVIDAVGKNEIVNNALELVNKRGRVGLYGVLTESQLNLDFFQWPNGALVQKLQWPIGHNAVHEKVIEYIHSGIIELKDFYSHILPFCQIEEGIEMVRRREAFKVIIEIE